MKVDPATLFWISLTATIGQGITSGTVHLTGLVPEAWIPFVTGWLSLIVFCLLSFLTALQGFSSNKSGPFAPPPTLQEAQAILDEAKKAAKTVMVLIGSVALVLALMAGSPSRAETPAPRPRPTTDNAGLPVKLCDPLNLLPGCRVPGTGKTLPDLAIEDLWDKIANASIPDLDYASALAKSLGTSGGKVRAACYDAILAAARSSQGAAVSGVNPPTGATLFTEAEKFVEVLDNLQPSGPIFIGCAAAAQMLSANTLTFINALIGGAAGLAALGVT